MRTMRLLKPGQAVRHPLVLTESLNSTPGEGEILLQISACAVCRTDLQICEGDLAARRLPIVPGHQIVGRVESVGVGVTTWKAGDRAGVAWLAGTAGTSPNSSAAKDTLSEYPTSTACDR